MAKRNKENGGAKAPKFSWNGSGDKAEKKAAWQKAEARREKEASERAARREGNRSGAIG